jgi:hypothetical protein
MRRFWVFVSLFALICTFGSLRCSAEDGNPTDPDDSSDDDIGGDADSDSDSDADSDSDSDVDSDSDSDGDTEESECSDFDGVDLLVIVDNSSSMRQEQQILGTSFYTLINALIDPVDEDAPTIVENFRLAVVSSDMGLQYGENGETEGFPYDSSIITCTDQDPQGDNGAFHTDMDKAIDVGDEIIECTEDATQCPKGWECPDGYCKTPSGDGMEAVDCPDLDSGDLFAESTEDDPNKKFATQVACLSQLGTDGCGVEMQLESGLRGLSSSDQSVFLKDNHLLAVIVVSDEEDCSVKDKGLYESEEWKSGLEYLESDPDSGRLNTACNLPEENEENFLFDTSRYREQLIALKDGHEEAVFFAAIVGVPKGSSSPCQGRGDKIGDCLDHDDMQLEIKIYDKSGKKYKHFAPACEREEGEETVTQARPGRRFVKVAQEFGKKSYVYSICNEDWSDAMKEIANLLIDCIIVE